MVKKNDKKNVKEDIPNTPINNNINNAEEMDTPTNSVKKSSGSSKNTVTKKEILPSGQDLKDNSNSNSNVGRTPNKSKNLKLDVIESNVEIKELPKIESEIDIKPEPKPKSTRGRKPKPKPGIEESNELNETVNETVNESVNESSEQNELQINLDLPKKSNRGRKPKVKTEDEQVAPQSSLKRKGKNPKESYGLIQDDEDEDDPFFKTSIDESKDYQEIPILKLNITAKDIQKIKDPNTNFLEGDSDLNIPHGFVPNTDTFSYFQGNISMGMNNIMKDEQKMTEKDIEDFRINREKELENSAGDLETSKLLCQFLEHNRKGTWPTKSNYDCMWCRFPFESVPWAVPTKLKDNDKYEVFGNFCSPGCVAAFIFDQYNDDEMWDYYALLNMLYQKVYDTTATVKTAPSTLLLKKLGGILTIEEFREITRNPHHDYFVKMPPMVSIIPSVEEIQQTSLFNDRGSHNQLNKELMMKASNELRLKRSKPIYDKNNTLDNYFHISSSELQN
jgi:hypothetical protein